MTAPEILHILQKDIHSVVFATIDDRGLPCSTVIDLMLADEKGLYFLTAHGKTFYSRLTEKPFVSISGIKGEETLSSIAITLRGPVENVGKDRLEEIFQKNPYMEKIYPTPKSRRALEVFCLYKGEGEYFDLSKQPPVRQAFSFGGEEIHERGYRIDKERCIGCQGCRSVCPSGCISNTFPRVIDESRCLHCGNCFQICLRKAVQKLM